MRLPVPPRPQLSGEVRKTALAPPFSDQSLAFLVCAAKRCLKKHDLRAAGAKRPTVAIIAIAPEKDKDDGEKPTRAA